MDVQSLPSTSNIPEGMEPSLRAMATGARKQHYPKGAVIVQEGDADTDFYILLKGSVKAYSNDLDGREVTYAVYRSPDYFGEMILDGGVRSASILALESTECAVMHVDLLSAILRRDPDFALHLLKRMISRSRSIIASARSMALDSAYERLARLLVHMAGGEAANGPREILGVSHLDLANWIGSSREMVTRLLNDLERGGYVETAVRRIVLKQKLPARW